VLICACLSTLVFGSAPFSVGLSRQLFRAANRPSITREMKERIPRSASLCATNRVASHFTNQRDLYVLPDAEDQPFDITKADYVLLQFDDDLNDINALYAYRDTLLRGGSHGLVFHRGTFALLARGADSAPYVAKTFYTADAEPRFRFNRELDSGLEFVGISFFPPRDDPLRCEIDVFWRATRRLRRDLEVKLHITNRLDEVTDHFIHGPYRITGAMWPPYTWEPGRTVRERITLLLPFDPMLGKTTIWAEARPVGTPSP